MPMLIYMVQKTYEVHLLEEAHPINLQEDQWINSAHQSPIQCKRHSHSKADVSLAAIKSAISLSPCSFY